MFNWLRDIVRRISQPKRVRYRHIKYIESISAVPANCGKDIYIIDRSGKARWVIFTCPCGRGRIEVNLMETKRPFWRLTIKNGVVTLSPSVIAFHNNNQKCHFWLENSRVQWCPD